MTRGGFVLEERRDQQYLRRPGDIAVRRSRKRKSALRRCVSLAIQAVVIGLVLLVVRQIHEFLVTSPLFAVRTIAVRGNHRAKTADLLAVSSTVVSRNIFRVDLDRLRQDICRSPWVLDASVRRSLPDTLEVVVQERKPSAIAMYEGRAWLVDASGRRLGEYGPSLVEFDLPVLTGFETLPRAEAQRRIETGAAAVDALNGSATGIGRRISELDLSAPDRIAIHLSDGSPVMYVDTHDYLRNLDNYTAIAAQISRTVAGRTGQDSPKIEYVDLRYRGRIAVMARNPEEGTLEK